VVSPGGRTIVWPEDKRAAWEDCVNRGVEDSVDKGVEAVRARRVRNPTRATVEPLRAVPPVRWGADGLLLDAKAEAGRISAPPPLSRCPGVVDGRAVLGPESKVAVPSRTRARDPGVANPSSKDNKAAGPRRMAATCEDKRAEAEPAEPDGTEAEPGKPKGGRNERAPPLLCGSSSAGGLNTRCARSGPYKRSTIQRWLSFVVVAGTAAAAEVTRVVEGAATGRGGDGDADEDG
jgi:hypothetical protein